MSEALDTAAPQDTPESAAVATETAQPVVAQPEVTPPAEAPKEEPGKVDESNKPTEQKTIVPEKYEIKLPEGSPLDASHIEKIASYAKERGLSNEDAQALLDRESSAVATYVDVQKNLLKEKSEGWITEMSKDKEIGGEAFTKNVEVANQVVDKYFTPEFKKILNETGLGNHPELLRGLYRIGKASAPDSLVQPKSQNGGARKIEDVFYGQSNKGEA